MSLQEAEDLAPNEREHEDVLSSDGADQERPQLSEVETIAHEMGWAPKGSWRGPEDKWVDAPTFIKNTRAIKDEKTDRIRSLEEQLRRVSSVAERIDASERQRRAAEAEQRIRDAALTGDEEAAVEAHRAAQQQPAQPAEPAAPIRDFVQRNASWWNVDQAATALAKGAAQKLADAGVVDPEQQIAAAEKEVRKRFPELFEEQQTERRADPRPQRDPPPVAGGDRAGQSRPAKKGWNELPREAKQAGEDFVSRGRIKDRETFAKLYWEENPA